MPTLPSFDVTQPQADRMLAAWGSTDNYTKWLRQQIIKYVIEAETKPIDQQYQTSLDALAKQRDDKVKAVIASLEDPANPYKPPSVVPRASQ